MSGARVKVTAEDPRYESWANRKPSKRKRLQEKILAEPGTYIRERAQKVATDTARRVVTNVARAALPAAAVGARAILSSAAGSAAVAVGLIGAALYAMQKIAEHADVSDGAKINRISEQFVKTQQDVQKQLGARSWQEVPPEIRDRLVKGYKAQIDHVTAYRRGTIRPSQQIPYGR